MDNLGNKVGEMRYKPFGETRYASGATPTDKRFTGQTDESSLGSLYDYGARFYSPGIMRFIQPDTIVQQPGNPQTLNRYSYCSNNPLRYTDPSGHAFVEDPYKTTDDPEEFLSYAMKFMKDEWDLEPFPGVSVRYVGAAPDLMGKKPQAGNVFGTPDKPKDPYIEVYDPFFSYKNFADRIVILRSEIRHSYQEDILKKIYGSYFTGVKIPGVTENDLDPSKNTCFMSYEWERRQASMEVDANTWALAIPKNAKSGMDLTISDGFKDDFDAYIDTNRSLQMCRKAVWIFFLDIVSDSMSSH